MHDKTPLYLAMIVGIVVIVGAVVLFNARSTVQSTPELTGNVIALPEVDATQNTAATYAFGKILFILFIGGCALYLFKMPH